MTEVLLGKTLSELQEVALSVGLQKFAGKQLANWLYVQRVSSFDQMTNISLKGREALQARYTIGRHAPVREAVSVDGTRKYLFAVGEQFIESVYIPEEDRATLCVSTQAGCKMGCRFCMTGTLGFHGHLSAAEILNQIFEIDSLALANNLSPLTNLVFMGEGEPMDNLDNVHNPFPSERKEIMPAEKMMSITDVVALFKQYDWSHQRRVSFEYICWAGANDTPRHAKELLRLLKGLNCRINLIRFHAGVDRAFPSSDEKTMEWLRDYLTDNGITTTIRKSRGEDILAACGMLVNALNTNH